MERADRRRAGEVRGVKALGAAAAILGFCATGVVVALAVSAFVHAADAMDKAFGDWPQIPRDFTHS